MTPRQVLLLFGFIFALVLTPLLAQTSDQKKPVASSQHAASVHQAPVRDGEQVFKQNCARCHAAPDGFSPRISGTVTRHMRVRASLSREDEAALLRFFNP